MNNNDINKLNVYIFLSTNINFDPLTMLNTTIYPPPTHTHTHTFCISLAQASFFTFLNINFSLSSIYCLDKLTNHFSSNVCKTYKYVLFGWWPFPKRPVSQRFVPFRGILTITFAVNIHLAESHCLQMEISDNMRVYSETPRWIHYHICFKHDQLQSD